MMNRQIRLEPDRLLAVDQGFLGLTAVEQNQREPASGRRVSGRQLDGETQVFERFVVLPELSQHHRQVPVSLCKIGPQLDRHGGSARPLRQDGPKPGSPDRACTGPPG